MFVFSICKRFTTPELPVSTRRSRARTACPKPDGGSGLQQQLDGRSGESPLHPVKT